MRDISLHILDIANNSLEAGATLIEISVEESVRDNMLRVRIKDNGKGMDSATVKRVLDPFYTSRTTRRVGLGLPLLKASSDRCRGKFSIESTPGQGTVVDVSFQYDNIDRPPLGNMPETVFSLIILNPSIDFVYNHRYDDKDFTTDTRKLREVLKGLPLNTPEVTGWLSEHLSEGILQIKP